MSRIRILHVVHKLDRGGTETWLLHVMRHIDRARFQMDFLVHTAEPGAYDDAIRALGGNVIVCEGARNPLRYARSFRRILRTHGPYDGVHSHLQFFSGLTLLLARMDGVPMRIAHSHLDTSAEERGAAPARRAYIATMKGLIRTQATHWLATSEVAATALFGAGWREQLNTRVLYCGIDFGPFDPAVRHSVSRRDVAIPDEALVVGHVGRFEDQKNHWLLIDVFSELRRARQDATLLLIGTGPLRSEIERRVGCLGLTGHVRFAGARDDVPALLRNVIDVFVFPSKYEGLGLALVEAQAAGVPCVVSATVPSEAIVVPELVRELPLDAIGPWVEAIVSQAERPRADRVSGRAFDRARSSRFAIERSVDALARVYASSGRIRG